MHPKAQESAGKVKRVSSIDVSVCDGWDMQELLYGHNVDKCNDVCMLLHPQSIMGRDL